MTRLFLLLLLCLVSGTALAEGTPIDLPDCTVGNPRIKFVQSLSDWYAINDPQFRTFCISPGDYRNLGEIKLTANGTADAPRYIVYNGESSDHPARMEESERAIIKGLGLEGAWWVVHRLTIRGEGAFVDVYGDDNLISQTLVEGGGGGAGQIKLAGGERVAIVDSVLRNTGKMAERDFHCIKATKPAGGIRLVGNEIYDCAGDGLQIEGSRGMLVEDNDFYVTTDMYTDCSGNFDPEGNCSCAENAIDIKSTTDSADPPPEEWVWIRNNRFWGFRRTDVSCSGTGSGGDAIVVHFDGAFVRVEDNLFFDSDYGFNTPNREAHDLHVAGNIFSQMFFSALTGLYKSVDGMFVNNTIADSGAGADSADESHQFQCNVFINSGPVDINGSADFNSYYNSEPIQRLGAHDLQFSRASAARHKDLKFIIMRHTTPAEVTLENAIATEDSPHSGICRE